jgi:anti-sigma factor RsiW
MECRDVREMADSFRAGELLTETNHEILRHLDTCVPCRADLAARREWRDRLRGAFQTARDLDPQPEFMTALRAKLHDAARQQPARRGVRLRTWWALAATVLLAVALGVGYRDRGWFTATGTLARAAVGDHRNCALVFRLDEKPIALEEAARLYGSAYGVLARVPATDVTTAVGPARVLERHACVYKGRRFAHLVLDYRGAHVSLLVTAADGSGQPAAGGGRPHVTSAGRIDGMSVVSFRASHQMVFLTGDLADADLMTLADAVAGPLYDGLAGA